MTQRPLTDDEKDTLVELNKAVEAAILTRRVWLDIKMTETSDLQVGDDIYDLDSGRRLGVVSRLYRYHMDDHGGIRDTSHHCSYEFETSPRSFDNTSRQSIAVGTREQAERHAQLRLNSLRQS